MTENKHGRVEDPFLLPTCLSHGRSATAVMEQAIDDQKSDLAKAIEKARRDTVANNMLSRELKQIAMRLLKWGEVVELGNLDSGVLGSLRGNKHTLDVAIEKLNERLNGKWHGWG